MLAAFDHLLLDDRLLERDRQRPLMLGFVLVGFFIWLTENIGIFRGVWRYPNHVHDRGQPQAHQEQDPHRRGVGRNASA